MLIVGAGLSGLMAACLIPEAEVMEASEEKTQGSHRALLRFRSPDVGHALGIPFKKVTVNKGIFFDDEFQQPSIQLANLYSKKVMQRVADRSIWKTETVERYIAPDDLYERMLARVRNRVRFDARLVDASPPRFGPIISTMPMPAMAKIVKAENVPDFSYSAIAVERFRVKDCDVYQTVYFPGAETTVYRASITGNMLIVEHVAPHGIIAGPERMREVLLAFGLYPREVEPLEASTQRFGKIAPVDDVWRRAFIRDLSVQHGIYSLGRFATWRNVLLDDVLQDIRVIQRLVEGDSYGVARKAIR